LQKRREGDKSTVPVPETLFELDLLPPAFGELTEEEEGGPASRDGGDEGHGSAALGETMRSE